jgi:hypothetical protein
VSGDEPRQHGADTVGQYLDTNCSFLAAELEKARKLAGSGDLSTLTARLREALSLLRTGSAVSALGDQQWDGHSRSPQLIGNSAMPAGEFGRDDLGVARHLEGYAVRIEPVVGEVPSVVGLPFHVDLL